MLVSLITLAIAIASFLLSRTLMDEVTRLLLRLVGLFCLFLSLVYAVWLVQLLIDVAIVLTPICAQPRQQHRITCSPVCIDRPQCLTCPSN